MPPNPQWEGYHSQEDFDQAVARGKASLENRVKMTPAAKAASVSRTVNRSGSTVYFTAPISPNFQETANQFKSMLDLFKRKLVASAVASLEVGADYLFEASQKKVPIDTGDLLLSGRVEDIVRIGISQWEILVTYNTRYALYVHEDLTLSHPPKRDLKLRYKNRKIGERLKLILTGGRTAKFLSGPLEDKKEFILAAMARSI